MGWLSFLSAPVNGLVGMFKTKQERKKLAEQAKAKLDLQKENGEQQLKLSDAEWEALNVSSQKDSWKDEYVTILITSPFLLIVLGAIQSAFGFGNELLDAAVIVLQQMNHLELDIKFLLEAVVLAALGLKIWRRS